MVKIQCPHCDKDVELENDVFGLFDCPHCDEEFAWEDDSDDRDVSNEYTTNPFKISGIKVGLGILLIAVIVCPVIPVLFGIDDALVLVYMFAALILFCIGIVVLGVSFLRKL